MSVEKRKVEIVLMRKDLTVVEDFLAGPTRRSKTLRRLSGRRGVVGATNRPSDSVLIVCRFSEVSKR